MELFPWHAVPSTAVNSTSSATANSANLVEPLFAFQANQPDVALHSVARGQHRFRLGHRLSSVKPAEAIIE